MLSDVIERVDLADVGENAGDGVVDERVVFPTVPKPGDDIEIFPRPLVAFDKFRSLSLISAFESP